MSSKKKENKKIRLVTFRLTPESYKKLDEIARKERRLVSQFLTIIVEDYLASK